jgi:Ca2+-binding RTX toxin-like protein
MTQGMESCMRARLAATVITAGTMVLGSLALAPQAQAASYTSNGVRCTRVGTPGPDVINGTSGNDVICGMGGNDTINAGGGNDVVDGGPGADVIHGGSGNDKIYGGAGNDKIYGDTGADAIKGDAGNDTIVGGDGNDVIWGLAGADTINAGSGNDIVDGGFGNDVIDGAAGNDRLAGSYDNDVVLGGDGADSVSGNLGNDDLAGGQGRDTLSGGAGTNWCDVSGEDVTYACKVDQSPAVATQVWLSSRAVDVSYGPKSVVAKVHVLDDTGVARVQVGAQSGDGSAYASGGMAVRTAGTPRDGWWTVSLRVAQFSSAGTMTVNVFATDRVGRFGGGEFRDALAVASTRPDLEAPVVRSATVSPSSLDVRSGAKTVSATVRISDDVAGAGAVYVCGAHLFADAFRQAGACGDMRRVSGTATDGYWTGSFTVPQGDVGGLWNIQIWVEDASRSHGVQYYVGPDQFAWETMTNGHTSNLALPGAAGRFTVTGSSDNNAPVLTTVSVSPNTFTSMSGPHTVNVDVAVTDVEGVTGVGAALGSNASPNSAWPTAGPGQLISGTPQNGVWRVPVDFVQGAPLATYYAQLWVEDRTHWVSWVSPGSPYEGLSVSTLTTTQAADGAVVRVE